MNKARLGVSVLALVLLAATAEAGLKLGYGVVIDTVERSARGYVADTRNSPDSMAYLGCVVYAFSTDDPFIICVAKDELGNQLSCSSSTPSMVAAAQAINGDSLLSFSVDEAGTCTRLLVGKVSYAGPKQP